MKRLPSIPPKAAAELRSVCAELALSDDALESLLISAQGVRFLEERQQNDSAPRRKKALEGIAQKARELNDALQMLAGEDRLNVHKGFNGLQIRMHLDPPDPLREAFAAGDFVSSVDGLTRRDVFCENVLLLGDVLLTLEVVAAEACNSVSGRTDGGAPSVLRDRAYHVKNVAYWAYKHGIAIGRSKDFVKLCTAFFKAAGIGGGTDPNPEPTIRYFVTNFLPLYLEMWSSTGETGDDQAGEQSG